MSKNDYWNEKENEKYQKMKIGMEYEDLDFKAVKRFSKVTNGIIKAICIPAIIIGILAFIIVFVGVLKYWKDINKRVDPDVLANLEMMYDEEFFILEHIELGKREEIFKLSPKSNEEIVCTMYKNGAKSNDDFQAQCYKYFVENILDENIRNKLTIDERQAQIPNSMSIITYYAYLEVHNFSQIEEYVEIMYQIRQEGIKQNKNVFAWITQNSWIKEGNYHSNVSYMENYTDIEDLIKQEKYEYIKYLKENNLSTEGIPNEELEKNNKEE